MNPKKFVFAVNEGKLFGFIVSKDGMMIEPERNEAISKVPPPHNKKSMQSFLGKINFVRRFVPRFDEIFKPLQDMIKKNACYKWGLKKKESFIKTKEEKSHATTLMSPDFNKVFIYYKFSSNIAFIIVLTQRTMKEMNSQLIL